MFITQDPIGLLGGVNNYLYVRNPLTYIDPFGLTAKPEDCPSSQKRPTHTDKGDRIKYIAPTDIKFKSMWDGDLYEFFVFDDNGDKLELGSMNRVDEDDISFFISNVQNPGVKIKPVGFSLTEAVISISILEHMSQYNGKVPANLKGVLAYSNEYNYQKEFYAGINDGLRTDEAAQQAIKNISFGKHREEMGYGDLRPTHSKESITVSSDATGKALDQPLENVPKKIGVDSYLTDQEKLDSKLDKYKDLHEGAKKP